MCNIELKMFTISIINMVTSMKLNIIINPLYKDIPRKPLTQYPEAPYSDQKGIILIAGATGDRVIVW